MLSNIKISDLSSLFHNTLLCKSHITNTTATTTTTTTTTSSTTTVCNDDYNSKNHHHNPHDNGSCYTNDNSKHSIDSISNSSSGCINHQYSDHSVDSLNDRHNHHTMNELSRLCCQNGYRSEVRCDDNYDGMFRMMLIMMMMMMLMTMIVKIILIETLKIDFTNIFISLFIDV